MGKGRRKKNVKQPADSKPSQSINISLPENIYAEELQQVIARAIVEAEKVKAQEEADRREADLREWHKVIGCKNYDNKLLNALNYFKVFFKILFLPKKHMKGNTASVVLLKSFISLFFWAMEWLSLLIQNTIHKNRLQTINQYKIGTEDGVNYDNRYDVTILVNGFPLIQVELKRRGVAIREAFNQIKRYQRDSF